MPRLDVAGYLRLWDDIQECGRDAARVDADLQALAKFYQYVHTSGRFSKKQAYRLKQAIRERMRACQG